MRLHPQGSSTDVLSFTLMEGTPRYCRNAFNACSPRPTECFACFILSLFLIAVWHEAVRGKRSTLPKVLCAGMESPFESLLFLNLSVKKWEMLALGIEA